MIIVSQSESLLMDIKVVKAGFNISPFSKACSFEGNGYSKSSLTIFTAFL